MAFVNQKFQAMVKMVKNIVYFINYMLSPAIVHYGSPYNILQKMLLIKKIPATQVRCRHEWVNPKWSISAIYCNLQVVVYHQILVHRADWPRERKIYDQVWSDRSHAGSESAALHNSQYKENMLIMSIVTVKTKGVC